MIDARPTLVSIFLKFANEVDADHLDDASVEPFLMRLLRLTEHPINRLCQTSRLAASALTRAELNRSKILASTPRAKATAETASTVLSSSPPS